MTASKEIIIADNRKTDPTRRLRFLTGGDTCGSATTVTSLPYNDSGTTVGMTDDYDLPTIISAPTVTGCPTCNATGGGPVEAAPRGGVFLGTGTGPDVAYSITFTSSNNSIDVTLTPTGSDDLALLVYTDVCSNSLSDAIVVDDDGAGGEAEHVVVSNMPAGTYSIVVDAYSTGGTPPGSSGPYTLDISGTGTIAGGPTPTATATATATPTGSGTPSIAGTVTYANAAVPPKFISNVTVTGTGSTNVFTTTAAPGGTAGQYTLTGFGSGSYIVALSKTTGANGINSFDAARVAQHVAGTGPGAFTTNAQRISADVTNNGAINSFDAGKIAQYVAGLPLAPPNLTGVWTFFVPNPTFPVGVSPTTRTYTDPIGNPTGQDYIGILGGEVTGNWAPGPLRPASGGDDGSTSVDLPSFVAKAERSIVISIRARDVVDKGIVSYEFDLRYDPSVIQPQKDLVDLAGTASRGLVVVANATEPGRLRVVAYGALPIDGADLLLNLKFTAVGQTGSVSPLIWERLEFNEGEISTTLTNGRVEIF